MHRTQCVQSHPNYLVDLRMHRTQCVQSHPIGNTFSDTQYTDIGRSLIDSSVCHHQHHPHGRHHYEKCHPSNDSLQMNPPDTPEQSAIVLGVAANDSFLVDAADYYTNGNYAHTVELCHRLHRADPSRTDALLLLGAAFYQLGDYNRCIAANDAAILIDPSIPEAHANLANALQQTGALDLAIAYYCAALQLKPNFTDAYSNLAAVYSQKGMVLQAIQSYSTALILQPECSSVRCSLGELWRSQGPSGRGAAEQCFATALQTDSQCFAAWKGLGDCAKDMGTHETALRCYQEAANLDPYSAEAVTGVGIALRELHRKVEAEAAFEAAARLRPQCPLALGNLAGAYFETRKFENAIDMYRQALVVLPNFPEALNNLGNALREVGRPEEAVECYMACIRCQLDAVATTTTGNPSSCSLPSPRGDSTDVNTPHAPPLSCDTSPSGSITPFCTRDGSIGSSAISTSTSTAIAGARLAVSYNNLGGVLKLLGRSVDCISAYENVVLLQRNSPEGHTNLGSAYKDCGHHDEAIASYSRALALKPEFSEAFANLVHSMQCVCDWRDRDALFARLEDSVRHDLQNGKLPSVQPFHALTYPFSAALILDISKRYAEECVRVARQLSGNLNLNLPFAHPPALSFHQASSTEQQQHSQHQERRLRVGYVSSDFGNHPLAHLMGSVFGLQDRSSIEVFCYSLTASDGSEWRLRIESESEHFVDVSSWTCSGQIAQRISDDGIHILVNLNGFTKGARNEIFALRPAPIQISLMGFPATMGAEFMDYIVLDSTVCPPESRHCYSEAVAFMPDTYFVNDYSRSHSDVLQGCTAAGAPTRASVGLPEDKVVFSCANQLYKYDPATFVTWCNILQRVPASVLWLLRFPPAGEARVRAAAAELGVDPNRIIFSDVAPKHMHIARSGLADVFLDTPACNAHTTGCDVLWGGCPMVTLPQERMASRVAASLCHATGLGSSMIVSNLEEYEERAVALGLNIGGVRDQLRAFLHAARETCALFDTRRWVRYFDKMLYKMWAIHCEGGGVGGYHSRRDFYV